MKRFPLLIIFLTLFIDMLGFGLILPLIPTYITHYGGSPAAGGWLMASFSAMQFIFTPIWGAASDRYGRRPIILLSLIGSAFSYFTFGVANSLTLLFFARIASGVLTAAGIPTTQAYIADVTPPEKRAGGMAMLGAAFGLGFAFGPWIGGVLSAYALFGFPALATPALFAAALALVNFVFALFLLPESLPKEERKARTPGSNVLEVFPTIVKALRLPSIRRPILVFAFATFAFIAVEASFSWLIILRFQELLAQTATQAWQTYQTLPLAQLPNEVRRLLPSGADWTTFAQQPFAALPPDLRRDLLERATTRVTGNLFGVVGITILFVQGSVMAGLARKIGEHRLVIAGSLLLTVVLLGLAFVPSMPMLYVLSALIAVGNGICNPSLSALITDAAGPTERGMISGAQHGLGSLARIIAPPINNTLVGMPTPAPFPLGCLPFLTSAVLMGVSFLYALQLKPMHRAEGGSAEEPAFQEIGH